MKRYLAIHTHEYGVSVYNFQFQPTDTLPQPPIEGVVVECKIDFEPEKGETIDIVDNDLTEYEPMVGNDPELTKYPEIPGLEK